MVKLPRGLHMIDLDGVPVDLSGPWLDLALIEREMGNRNILTLRLDRLLERGVLTRDCSGDYCWTDGSGGFLLGVRRVCLLSRLKNRLLGRCPVEDYLTERREFHKAVPRRVFPGDPGWVDPVGLPGGLAEADDGNSSGD
jgi:hypothetical protein